MNVKAADPTLIDSRFRFDGLWSAICFGTMSRTLNDIDLMSFTNMPGPGEPVLWSAYEMGGHALTGRIPLHNVGDAVPEGVTARSVPLAGLAFLHLEIDPNAPVRVGDTTRNVAEDVEPRAATSEDREPVCAKSRVGNRFNETGLTYRPLRMEACGPQSDESVGADLWRGARGKGCL